MECLQLASKDIVFCSLCAVPNRKTSNFDSSCCSVWSWRNLWIGCPMQCAPVSRFPSKSIVEGHFSSGISRPSELNYQAMTYLSVCVRLEVWKPRRWLSCTVNNKLENLPGCNIAFYRKFRNSALSALVNSLSLLFQRNVDCIRAFVHCVIDRWPSLLTLIANRKCVRIIPLDMTTKKNSTFTFTRNSCLEAESCEWSCLQSPKKLD